MRTQKRVTGFDPRVWEYALLHLRASGPCSFASLQNWISDQVIGVGGGDDAKRVTSEFLDSAQARRVVSIDDGAIDIVYH